MKVRITPEIKSAFSSLIRDNSMKAFSPPREAWSGDHMQAMECITSLQRMIDPTSHIVIPRNTAHLDFNKEIKGEYDIAWRGLFEVHYKSSTKENIGRVMTFLSQCMDLVNKAELNITRPVKVFIGGKDNGTTLASYISKYYVPVDSEKEIHGVIRFIPTYLGDSSALGTAVHELVHLYHDQYISGGFDNTAIKGQYAAHKNDTRTKATGADAIAEEYKALYEDFIKGAMAYINGIDPGAKFEESELRWPNIKYYLYIPGKKMPWYNNSYFKRNKVSLLEFMYGNFLSDNGVGKRMTNSALSRLDSMRKEWKRLNDLGGTEMYRHWQSKWIPTDYAKTRYEEWFAEVGAACIIYPDDVDPEVLKWFKNVINDRRQKKTPADNFAPALAPYGWRS